MEAVVHPIYGTFVIESVIGRGTFATVLSAHHQKHRFPVAIKVYDPDFADDPENQAMVRQEVDIHKHISHPLIARVYDSFMWNGHLCILMEKVTGVSLLDYTNRCIRLQEDEARHIIGQLILVLAYLKEVGVVHRDIKCENIILDHQGFIHVIDFAFARQAASCDDTEPTGNALFSTSCGSPAYAAPEIFRGEEYGFGVDMWSAGVVLYAMLHGSLPFQCESTTGLIKMIVSAEPALAPFLSHDCLDLLKRMLDKDPEKRISTDDAQRHTWLTTNDAGDIKVLDGSVLMLLRPRYTRHGLNHRAVANLQLDAEEQGKLIDELESGVESKRTMLYKMMDQAICAIDLVVQNPPIFIAKETHPQRVRAALSRDDCLKLVQPRLAHPHIVRPLLAPRSPIITVSTQSLAKPLCLRGVKAPIRVRRHSHCLLEDTTDFV